MNLMGKTESDPLFLTTVRNQCLCFTFEENSAQTHDINIAGLGNKPSGHPCFFILIMYQGLDLTHSVQW